MKTYITIIKVKRALMSRGIKSDLALELALSYVAEKLNLHLADKGGI